MGWDKYISYNCINFKKYFYNIIFFKNTHTDTTLEYQFILVRGASKGKCF